MTPEKPPEFPPNVSYDAFVNRKRAERLKTTPVKYRGWFERSWTGQAPPRAAIKAFCLECIGFERKLITTCTSVACPLFAYRPYQTKETETTETEE